MPQTRLNWMSVHHAERAWRLFQNPCPARGTAKGFRALDPPQRRRLQQEKRRRVRENTVSSGFRPRVGSRASTLRPMGMTAWLAPQTKSWSAKAVQCCLSCHAQEKRVCKVNGSRGLPMGKHKPIGGDCFINHGPRWKKWQ